MKIPIMVHWWQRACFLSKGFETEVADIASCCYANLGQGPFSVLHFKETLNVFKEIKNGTDMHVYWNSHGQALKLKIAWTGTWTSQCWPRWWTLLASTCLPTSLPGACRYWSKNNLHLVFLCLDCVGTFVLHIVLKVLIVLAGNKSWWERHLVSQQRKSSYSTRDSMSKAGSPTLTRQRRRRRRRRTGRRRRWRWPSRSWLDWWRSPICRGGTWGTSWGRRRSSTSVTAFNDCSQGLRDSAFSVTSAGAPLTDGPAILQTSKRK